ncbi:gamma-interferon-inducible lysosomal thiol reductase-like [Oratosquilla oratoria]|uniref:gamma-interferon-inducible lysosomal thiol reductase-like n=1 Tax=Oratosquilla oratoria TaxID=337810 RepID=UPI003F76291F
MDMGGGRLIRILILLLVLVLVWKVYDYKALQVAESSDGTPAKEKADETMVNDAPMAQAKIPSLDLQEDLEVPVQTLVRVAVYYEALCPDSRHYIIRQLAPAFAKLSDIMKFELVPYGKARTKEKDGKITFSCQHGQKECEANRVHACVTKHVKDETTQLNIVACMIKENDKPNIGKECVNKYNEDWNKVETCSTSEEGDQILKHMGKLTHALDPKVSFIPTITINDKQDSQQAILKDLVKEVCKRYNGPKIDACP